MFYIIEDVPPSKYAMGQRVYFTKLLMEPCIHAQWTHKKAEGRTWTTAAEAARYLDVWRNAPRSGMAKAQVIELE